MENTSLYDYMMELYNKNNYIEFGSIINLLNLYGIDNARVLYKWNHYKYKDIGVPRVTNILDSTNSKNLSGWIANLGRQYFSTRRIILDTGSLAHEMIEDYIMNGSKAVYYDEFKAANIQQSENCYLNFIDCYKDIQSKGYSIDPICVERPIVTPFFGGTCDCIAKLTFPNNDTKTFILDFKTSKKISYEYFIQVMFYTLGIKFLNEVSKLNIIDPIDGIGIIRVNKEGYGYNYVFADFEHDPDFMQALIQSVYSLLDWYYHQISIQIYTKDFEKQYIP